MTPILCSNKFVFPLELYSTVNTVCQIIMWKGDINKTAIFLNLKKLPL